MSLKTAQITAEDVWTAAIELPPGFFYVRIGVLGTPAGGTKIRLRWRDPEMAADAWHHTANLFDQGESHAIAAIGGPAVVQAGCAPGEFGDGDDLLVSLRRVGVA